MAPKPTYEELEKVLNFFICNNYSWKVLIEKPVSYSLDTLNILVNKKNFYFFIDELVLNKYYKKIFNCDISSLFLKLFVKYISKSSKNSCSL